MCEQAKARLAKEQADREADGKARIEKQQEQIRVQIGKAQELGRAGIAENRISK